MLMNGYSLLIGYWLTQCQLPKLLSWALNLPLPTCGGPRTQLTRGRQYREHHYCMLFVRVLTYRRGHKVEHANST